MPEALLLQKGKPSLMVFVSEDQKPPAEVLVQRINNGSHVHVCHVKNNSHFVLATGSHTDLKTGKVEILVNDPFYDVVSYPYENISDIITYSLTSAVIQRPYPLFKQCNSSWGNDTMVTTTVCAVGCLMSSISMALGGHSIPIPTSKGYVDSNPRSLNNWLKANGGYDSSNDLDEAAVAKMNPSRISWPADGMHVKNDLSVATVIDYLKQGRVVIANVMKGHHFVLVTGYDLQDTVEDRIAGKGISASGAFFYVHDPGFTTGIYSYAADVVGWRLFDMK